MRASIVVLNPVVNRKPEVVLQAGRPNTLDGKVVGLLANRKRNSDKLLEMIGEMLQVKFNLRELRLRYKDSTSRPFSPELRDQIAGECDVVITAIGDCGSCSLCSIHDAIELEKRGIPTAVLVTEHFASAVAAMSELRGLPNYYVVVVPHPIGSRTETELRDIAAAAFSKILESLLSN